MQQQRRSGDEHCGMRHGGSLWIQFLRAGFHNANPKSVPGFFTSIE